MPRIGLSALALFALGAPHAAWGQTPEHQAHASLELSLSGTPVRESATTLVGAAGLLNLGGRFTFGAGGALMLGSSAVASAGAGSDLELRLAYGGLFLQVTVAGSPNRYVALRSLVGAGNAKLRLPVVGSEFAADNFGVLEPEVVGTFTLVGPLQVGAGVGYRHVFGVDDLPGVAPGDLKGPLARIRISVRTH